MGLDRLDSLAILDALAPDPGWTTDLAILSSYSVDLVAAAAIIMALAGEGDDHERMHRAPLARACESMRDRFRIVCQAGRILVPGAGTTALALADRWVREVHHNGNERSWHAKMCLVRYSQEQEGNGSLQSVWRLWVGSRNLTRDTSWDSALIAEGRPSLKPSSEAEAIARAGFVLASRADIPDWSGRRVQRELNTLKWIWPYDVSKIESFDLWTDAASSPGFPAPPAGVDRVITVSPFIDPDTAVAMATWGSRVHQRQLLTIPQTMEALLQHPKCPLDGFTSLHQIVGTSAPEDFEEDRGPTEEDQLVEVHRGLHAKLIWAQTPKGDHLWLGSANLTRRAWDGRNSEVMVHLRVLPSVGKGLSEGILEDLAEEVHPSDEAMGTYQQDEKEKQLDALRNRIAGTWTSVLKFSPDGREVHLIAQVPPLELGDRAKLKVRLFGTREFQVWPPGEVMVRLPGVALHQQTELVELILSGYGPDGASVSWIARAPFDPEPGLERDRAVLAKLMGPRAFLAWLGTLLDEVTGGGSDQLWPEREEHPVPLPSWSRDQGLAIQIPTLESVLRAWARNQKSVLLVDHAMQTWANGIASSKSEECDELERLAFVELGKFISIWQTIRVGLGLDREGK